MRLSSSSMKRFAFALAILGTGAVQAGFSQNANSGEIKGEVTDASGAVIAGASVVLVNTATGVSTRTETNGAGIYDVPSLPTGPYTITFSKGGFRDEVRSGIILQVATVAVDAAMQIGTANQQVVVTGDVPLLQTEDSAQHLEIDTKAVQDAPVVGGIWYNELTNELPGVNGGGSQDASGQGIGINGTEGYSGTFLIEGSLAQEPRDANASDNYPPIDAIQSVNVETSNFGAQYGNGVAAFNLTVKSGTNRFHGSLFEFNQNNDYNSRSYFDRPPLIMAPLHWNEFGGSIGGPIVKDKLFFFFTFQDNPNSASAVYTTTVPTNGQNGTTNMLAGCFPGPVNDPSTGTPYPGNCITSQLDPVALNIQKYLPAPNFLESGSNPYLNNYSAVAGSPTTSRWYVGKLDYSPTQKHRISASYLYFPIGLDYDVDAFCSLGFDCSHGNNYNEDGQVTDVWTISPTLVNEARIGGVREVDKYIPPTLGKGYPSTIGLEPTYGNDAPANIFPSVTVDNGGGIGGVGINGGVHADLADGALVESDIVTLIRGRHTIKMGGEFDKSYQNYTGWGDITSGNFVFNGVATNVPYADFLLGEVYGWYVYEYPETGARMWNTGAFVQDDFKVLPSLTLNLGFRYQYQGGWGEVQNRWGTFSPSVVNGGPYVKPGTLGAMVYGPQSGRGTIQNGANQWVPRVGFSWSPVPKWAFRASYGISDQPWSVDPYTAAYGVGLNPTGSEGYGSSPAFLLKNGPGAGAVLYPTLSTVTNYYFNYQDVTYFPTVRHSAYYQEALLSVQRELPFQMLVDASYLLTKGTHLGFARDIDQVPESLLPGYGTAYTNCYNDPTAYPQFCSVSEQFFDGYSNYNALQLRVEKRTSYGLSFLFNYAWSKTMDTGTGSGNNATADVWQNAYNVRANYGLSLLNMANSINGSATYELPLGAGKQYPLHGAMDEALGGWRVTGIYQIHSGLPFTVDTSNSGVDDSGSEAGPCGCGYSWLPNVVGNPHVSNPSISEWFNPSAFATPATGTFGDERRNSLIGPNWRDLDLSIGKSFALVEGMRLEIRADAFDAFNHPFFSQPSNVAGTDLSGGGEISGTVTSTQRDIQLGGRLTF
jgi:Carboxypeptidase regulatory-like domain